MDNRVRSLVSDNTKNLLNNAHIAQMLCHRPTVLACIRLSYLQSPHSLTLFVSCSALSATQVFKTIAELKAEQAAARAARTNQAVTAVAAASGPKPKALSPLLAAAPPEKRIAVELLKELFTTWKTPMETLSKAGRAFDGLEALLGGGGGGNGGFELGGNIWGRQGWAQMDELRKKLEDLKVRVEWCLCI